MIYQDNKKLLYEIRKDGCYFLSLLFIVQIENKSVLSAEDINLHYKYCVDKRYMQKNCFIVKPDKIVNSLIGNKKIKQTGSCINNKFVYWGNKIYNYSIIENTTLLGNKHYTLGDSKFDEYYDSLLGSTNCSPNGRYILYYVE